MYNYNRERKAKCVMGLGIMFLIYNFFRCMAIIARILGRKNGIDPNIHSKIISRIRDELEKGEFNDIRSEEKA